jgi:hypothetical protein
MAAFGWKYDRAGYSITQWIPGAASACRNSNPAEKSKQNSQSPH